MHDTHTKAQWEVDDFQCRYQAEVATASLSIYSIEKDQNMERIFEMCMAGKGYYLIYADTRERVN